MKIHNKLIRDKIPEIIEATGEKAVTRVLDRAEFISELETKLLEEAKEVRETPIEKKAEELADVFEVMDALVEALGFTKEQVLEIKREKRQARGGFLKRLFLERTE